MMAFNFQQFPKRMYFLRAGWIQMLLRNFVIALSFICMTLVLIDLLFYLGVFLVRLKYVW